MDKYIFVSQRQWNIESFRKNFGSDKRWTLITQEDDLNESNLEKINPKYIFFPDWSHIVPERITNRYECICFHETDLPYGRGGSPIQNLIIRGKKETHISAIKMTSELDGGPIYLKHKLSLIGLAEEIYIRCSGIIVDMTKQIINSDIVPTIQEGNVIKFQRRKPCESKIPTEISNLEELFDFIRMLDAEGYPKAFIQLKNFRIDFTRPALRTNGIEASVKISIR